MKRFAPPLLVLIATLVGLHAPTAHGRTDLRNICRVKGQEENVLRGVGLVVGLAGTGEAGDAATMRALARAMEVMGAPIPEIPTTGAPGLDELSKIKNVAMVIVTARVPATGARRGDKLNCYVSGVNGKSLAGGRLAFAALKGPNTMDKTVYALCEGAVHLEDATKPLSGVVYDGCQMEEDVMTSYIQDGKITLVLDKHHANFQTAADVADALMRHYSGRGSDDEVGVEVIDSSNIVLEIPKEYELDPVSFVAAVLETEIYSTEPEARVVINPRTNSVVMSGDVTIGDVVVMQNGVEIQTALPVDNFIEVDVDQQDQPKLTALLTALNQIKMPPEDVVEVIKNIDRSGKLHARLIIE